MKKLTKKEMKEIKGGNAGYIWTCYLPGGAEYICARSAADIYAACNTPDNPPPLTNCTGPGAACNYVTIWCP